MSAKDQFGRYYESATSPYYGVPSGHLKACLEFYAPAPGRALDVGCGDGRNALYLASLGYEVCAFDLSPAAIVSLDAFSAQHGLPVQTAVADMMAYDYGDRCYDLLVAETVLGHAARPDADGLVDGWKRCLAPGGHICVTTFTTADPAYQGETKSETTGFVDTFYDPTDFRTLFDGLTEQTFAVETWLDTSHGPPHHHTTVRYFGRKPV